MIKPLTQTIPTDRAWKQGRRIYVRCGYQSQLNSDLRNLGAKWDPDARALWVGTGKADKVTPLIEAAAQRQAETVAVKATATTAGLWVNIPFDASGIREQAKRLGARWDAPTKRWAMPTPEAHAEITGMVDAYRARIDQDRAARKQAAATARAEQAAQDKADAATRAARIIERSGRTLTGETTALTQVSTARYNRASAEAAAHPIGHVLKLKDGRRGIVTAVKVWFTNDDLASSVCWHAETHDEAHWDFRYDIAIVEPTDAETAADQAEAARKADQAELADVFRALERADRTEAGEREAWSAVSGPAIQRHGGSVMRFDDGRIVLDGDRAVWQHPGYYDDYRRSERFTTDPDVVARVRALIDRGPRTVGAYTVTEA